MSKNSLFSLLRNPENRNSAIEKHQGLKRNDCFIVAFISLNESICTIENIWNEICQKEYKCFYCSNDKTYSSWLLAVFHKEGSLWIQWSDSLFQSKWEITPENFTFRQWSYEIWMYESLLFEIRSNSNNAENVFYYF